MFKSEAEMRQTDLQTVYTFDLLREELTTFPHELVPQLPTVF